MSQIANKPSPSRPPVAPARLPLLRPEHRKRVGTGLLALSTGFVILVLVLLIRSGFSNLPVTIWGAVLALVLALAGGWAHLGEPQTPEEAANQMRLLGLTVGGAVGFATAVLGLALPIFTYASVFAGGLEVWRQHWWRVMLCGLALFGGLALMFLSLQLGRTAERTSPSIRRLLYGYNAALTGLLLLAILALVNVLAYVRLGPLGFFSKPWDWTASGIYSLSPATENFLKHLDKPVKVYMLIPSESLLGKETERLLDNCRGFTDKMTWTSVSRDLNRRDLAALVEKYQVPESYGLLVVYGSEPGEQHEFIRAGQLYSDAPTPKVPGREERTRFIFKGEGVLLKALEFLSVGKKKAVVYFTQGNGEPELNRGMGADRFVRSVGDLRERLTRRNYEVKELTFSPGVDKVPSDAEVVVVINPRTGLPDNAVKALNDYMNPTGARPKGKLMFLADVVVKGDRSGMVASGLEGLLGRMGVRVGNERILAPKPNPTEIVILPALESRNPIPRGFVINDQVTVFRFDDVRPLEAAPPPPGGPNPYKVETILYTYPRMPVWKEADLRDPSALVEGLLTPDRIDELRKRFARRVPVAVAVSESSSRLPNIPQHRNLAGGEDKPRLVVFGDSTWVLDEALTTPGGRYNADLFSSCLSWLRQRPDIGADVKEGTDRKEYTLAGVANPDMISRLRWTPLALMLLTIVGLGGTVWLMRRR